MYPPRSENGTGTPHATFATIFFKMERESFYTFQSASNLESCSVSRELESRCNFAFSPKQSHADFDVGFTLVIRRSMVIQLHFDAKIPAQPTKHPCTNIQPHLKLRNNFKNRAPSSTTKNCTVKEKILKILKKI